MNGKLRALRSRFYMTHSLPLLIFLSRRAKQKTREIATAVYFRNAPTFSRIFC